MTTYNDIINLIQTNLADNNSGDITPKKAREVAEGIVDYVVQDGLPNENFTLVLIDVAEGIPAEFQIHGLDDGDYDIFYRIGGSSLERVTETSTGGVLDFDTRIIEAGDMGESLVVEGIKSHESKLSIISATKERIVERVTTDITVLLSGAYGTGGIMRTDLNDKGLLPFQQPYNVAPWNYAGDETVLNFDADVVDWVLVSLRDENDLNTVLFTAAALLYKDGSVRDVEGNLLQLEASSGNLYYVEIQHRNHLGIVTEDAEDISQTIDFTSYGTARNNGQEPQFESESGIYAMYGGNANPDNHISYLGFGNDHGLIIADIGKTNEYILTDVNMDGDVTQADIDFLRDDILGGNTANIIFRQY